MRSRTALFPWLALADCILLGAACHTAPMGTASTYQGRFNTAASPANGAYDFEFRLFDAASAGNQVGNTISKPGVDMNAGYLTATLDFGPGHLNGDARLLQIAVRAAGGGAYTPLDPRLELTPTPYTFYASYEGSTNCIPKLAVDGSPGSVLSEHDSSVGIEMTNHMTKLYVHGAAAGVPPNIATTVDIVIDAKQSGVLAQELEQVFPELATTPEPVRAEGLLRGYSERMLSLKVRQQDAAQSNDKAVSYSEFTAVLLEAVNELKQENDVLRA